MSGQKAPVWKTPAGNAPGHKTTTPQGGPAAVWSGRTVSENAYSAAVLAMRLRTDGGGWFPR